MTYVLREARYAALNTPPVQIAALMPPSPQLQALVDSVDTGHGLHLYIPD